MENKDNSERIERFLREQMSPEENDAFLNDLKNDKDLREEAQMMVLMIKEMKEEQIKQSGKLTEDVLAEEKQANTARIISMVRWPLSIAAMFILIFGATLLWNRQSDTEILFNEYYQPYVVQGERGGDDDAIKEELANLYNKVGTEDDVTPIITRLQTIYDNILSNNVDYAEYIYYEKDIVKYLALAYIKNNDLDKAKSLLKPYAEDGDDEAAEVIKAIDSIK
ncbi:hypothetical protein SAMN04487901_107114 [Prevotella communis]|uniref:Tetratricopeptide repeat-containing protein n=1 Tax=Prevotella communis TaxID=2913614 RepID=A0A1G7WAF2_9BACT|nr:hypothetical protein [Prevotella communis]SDG68922.1 hypothetical protein SAMN04487901_107114 [Prevotella communis]